MEQWEPHTVTTRERIDPGPVAALAALFDNGLAAPGPGDELPPLWHWVALPRLPASSQVGADGHPARRSFLPPVDLPRRMFAGGEVTWHSELRVGETVGRASRVESVTEKHGRSGRLVVVVGTRIYGDSGALAVAERRDLIYRKAEKATAPPEPDATAPPRKPPRCAARGAVFDARLSDYIDETISQARSTRAVSTPGAGGRRWDCGTAGLREAPAGSSPANTPEPLTQHEAHGAASTVRSLSGVSRTLHPTTI